ncbi:MAG: hypothetical protein ABH952_05085 [Candidatus Omnitrophota bacterium]
MNLHAWQMACQYIIVLGVVISAIGSFGSFYFGKKIEQTKDKEITTKEAEFKDKLTILIKGNEVIQNHLKTAYKELTDQQKEKLVLMLAVAKEKNITINAVLGGQGSFELANRLKTVFIDAGWNVNGVNQSVYNVPFVGLFVSIPEGPTPEEANVIYRGFKTIGYEVKGNRDANQQNRLALIVGSKL